MSLLLSGLSVGAPSAAQAATDPPKTVHALDTLSMPGFLTVSGGRAHYLTESEAGTTVLAYGNGKPIPAAQRQTVWDTYATSEPYGHGDRTRPLDGTDEVTPLQGAFAFSQQYLNAGDAPGLVALTRDSSGAVSLVLLGQQSFGLRPLLAPFPLADQPTSVAVVRMANQVGFLIVTGGPTGLRAYEERYDSTARTFSLLEYRLKGASTERVLDLSGGPVDGDKDANGGFSTPSELAGLAVPDMAPTQVELRRLVFAYDYADDTFNVVVKEKKAASLLSGKPAVSGDVETAAPGDGRPAIASVTDADGRNTVLLVAGSVSTATCGDGSPAGVAAVESGDYGDVLLACGTVDGDGRLTTTTWFVYTPSTGVGVDITDPVTQTELVPGALLAPGVAPVLSLSFPGAALQRLAQKRQPSVTPPAAPNVVTVSALVRQAGSTAPARLVARSETAPASPLANTFGSTATPTFGTPVSTFSVPINEGQTGTGRVLALPLPQQANTVELQVPATPTRTQAAPVPVAFLQAPPQVGGAHQDSSPPVYGVTTSQNTSNGTSQSTRIGATLGLSWEDPTGAFGVEADASYSRDVEQSYATSSTVSQTESYTGSSDDNAVVYRATNLDHYEGTVARSSLGVALGTPVSLDLPVGSVTSVATVSAMQSRFKEFAPGGSYATALSQVFGNTVGDPGSYLAYGDGTSLDDYCDGTRTSAIDPKEVQPPSSYLPPNPFAQKPPPTRSGPYILTSDPHTMIPGNGTAEGASVGVETGQSTSYVSSHSLDVTAGFTAGYVKASVNAGATWATDWSSELTDGVDFSGEVASIPNGDLKDESYDWRMFMCHKTVTGPGGSALPVYVQAFTVDNYRGSGGLQELGPVQLVSPIQSAVVAGPRPTLTWDQPSGSVKSWTWQLEAVGRPQVASGTTASFATPQAGTPVSARNPGGRAVRQSVTVPVDLYKNQLYRWRVTALDFFGYTTTSDYEFFTTDGPPSASFTPSTLTPDAGQAVTLTNTSSATDPASPITYAWDFGDGTTSTDMSPVHTWTTGGTYVVTLVVTSSGGTSTTQVTVTVAGTAVGDSYSGLVEDQSFTVDSTQGVLANDGGTTASLLTAPSHGTVSLAPDGSFTYTPAPDYCGTDRFSYYVDGNRTRAAEAVLQIACRPDAPVVTGESLTGQEDVPVSLQAPGLLANDRDPDSTPTNPVTLLLTSASSPAHGTVVVKQDGSATYTPDPDYCGRDSFTYTVSDGQLTAQGVATIDLACVNDAPRPLDDKAATAEDTPVAVPVLVNDVDPEGGALSVLRVTAPGRGTVTQADGGRLVYTPGRDLCGPDSFTYTVADPQGLTALARVDVDVTCVNDPPVANDDTQKVQEDGSVDVAVLANDTDPDGDPLTVTVPFQPAGGTATVVFGVVHVVPDPDFCGDLVFDYVDTDTSGAQDAGRVTVTVACVNDAPVAVDDAVTVAEDTTTPLDVLANDRDADGDQLALAVVQAPAHGTVATSPTGLVYAPAANYCGSDQLRYSVTDPAGLSATATVSLTVTCVDDTPVGTGDLYVRPSGSRTFTVAAPGVLANDTDVDTAPTGLRAVLVSTTPSGNLVLQPDGSFSYTPRTSNQGGDSFYYRVTDGTTSSGPVRVVIQVTTGKSSK